MNTIRCCISCILPCGALDVIRIVHCNGKVEEISGTIKAEEIMKAYPKHILKKPSLSPSDEGIVSKIVIVPPDAELKRGKIYFLIPLRPTSASSNPEKISRSSRSNSVKKKKKNSREPSDHHHHPPQHQHRRSRSDANVNPVSSDVVNVMVSHDDDRYLNEILSEKLSTVRDRRHGRVAVWRPHLQSICESPSDF